MNGTILTESAATQEAAPVILIHVDTTLSEITLFVPIKNLQELSDSLH